jgi:osomolarity two-component system response regulator SKN7
VKNTDDNQFGEHVRPVPPLPLSKRYSLFNNQSWTFRHPDFHAERRDTLENIKRKVPTQRKPTTASTPAPNTTNTTTASTSHSPTSPTTTSLPNLPPSSQTQQTQTQQTLAQAQAQQTLALQSQIDTLKHTLSTQASHILSLERNYQDVLVEMVQFQRNMAQQDGLMQNLIQYFLGVENGEFRFFGVFF